MTACMVYLGTGTRHKKDTCRWCNFEYWDVQKEVDAWHEKWKEVIGPVRIEE